MRLGAPLSARQIVFVVGCALLVFWFLLGMIPAVFAPARESARRTACQSNPNQIGRAIFMYADVPANNSQPPPSLNLLLSPAYIADKRCFWCPSCKAHADNDYAYVPGLKLTGAEEKRLVLAHDAKLYHGEGRNVLLTDGTVEFMREAEFWKALKEGLGPTPPSKNTPQEPKPSGTDGARQQAR